MPSLPTCNLCAGTGKTLTRISFPTESFGSARCYVCKGTRETKSQASNDAIADQTRMRRMAKPLARKMEIIQ